MRIPVEEPVEEVMFPPVMVTLETGLALVPNAYVPKARVPPLIAIPPVVGIACATPWVNVPALIEVRPE